MTQTLSKLSEDLAQVVSNADPSVVRVDARRRLPASGIVWSSDGIIVTAHHTVERDDNISVGLPGGETTPGELVGRDPTTDVAVLRVQSSGLTAASWADLISLRVGHLVLALGRPGPTVLATLGIVSALGDAWRTPAGGTLDRYLQTDVVMYPGFSGGPLVDSTGHVLGLNSSALARGIALAVPPRSASRVVDALLEHGRVRRGYLGVGAQPVRLPQSLAERIGQETGLLLVSVESGSPADRGGLLLGDVIIALDGQTTRHLDDLLALLGGYRVGVSTTARVVRGGALQDVAIVIGEH